jgi:hypothetical protein
MVEALNSSKCESATLSIPSELLARIKIYAESSARGNTSQTILRLIEVGLLAINSQSYLTLQDTNLQPQLNQIRETVAALVYQIDQLTLLEMVLIEASFSTISNHQFYLTAQDTNLQPQLNQIRETVAGLVHQIDQLTKLEFIQSKITNRHNSFRCQQESSGGNTSQISSL